MDEKQNSLGEQLFKLRDYTPIPLIILVLLLADPNPALAMAGTIVMVLGELIRIYSVAFIGGISRTRSGSLGDQLVREGPFAYVRNPLYVGNFFICFGLALVSSSFFIVILTVAMFAFQYHYIVKYEEGLLQAKFGDDFLDFKEDVAAWIPKRWPTLEEISWPDTFSPALKSEKRTLAAIFAMLLALMVISLIK